jgi:hypothetical protein
MRLVAGEAGRQIGLVVDLLVRAKRLILPFAVPNVILVLGAPAVALFHHRVGDEVALLETAVGILERLAGRIELRADPSATAATSLTFFMTSPIVCGQFRQLRDRGDRVSIGGRELSHPQTKTPPFGSSREERAFWLALKS